MNLASHWVKMYQDVHGLKIEAARELALATLNKQLGCKVTRGDLYRWEQGAGMSLDRRRFLVNEVIPYLSSKNGWALTALQQAELAEAVI